MISKGSSLAKISRPRITGIVPRVRLFNLLDSGREKKTTTWISGPAGSGKTTLVASYLDAFNLPCLWYEVDEGDCDLATFFYYMGLAAKMAAPRSRKPLPFLTPEYRQGITTFTLRYFENLYSRLKPPFVLVFDRYQNATCDAGLHQAIKEGLSIVPGGIHVMMISRTDLLPEFTRLRANNKINFIGWDELKFNLEETREFVRKNGLREVNDEALKTLHSRTEGWAAGMVLLLEGLGSRLAALAASEKLKQEEIFNYFAKEIFEKCQINVQQFLLKTSFLPRMTPHMADRLTGGSKAHQILSELNRKNYFTQQASGSEIYRYHSLFREFLRARSQQFFIPDDILQIKRKAARILEEDGLLEDAIVLFRDAGEWHKVTRLILEQAPLMTAQGRGQTLTEWIGRLPKSVFGQNPFLYFWLGTSRMPYDPHESLRHLETAFHLFKQKKDPVGVFLAFSGVIDTIVHGLQAFKQLDQWISIFYKLRSEYKDFPSEEIEARVTMSMLYALCLRQPQHPDYETWSERAFSLARRIKDDTTKSHIYIALGIYRLYSGELSKAAVFMDSFREAAHSPDITPMALIMLKDFQAFYYWLTSNFEECNKAATDGLELASSKGVHLLDSLIAGNAAAGALSAGDMGTAERFIQELKSRQGGMTAYAKSLYDILMTWKALLQNDLRQALLHAEFGLELSHKVGTPFTEAVSHLGMALVMHGLKKEKEASVHISEIHTISRSTNIYQVDFRCLLAEAQFAFDRGDRDSARAILRRAMAEGREQGYTNTFFWMPSVMAGLCVEALEAGIEVDYVRDLVRKRNLIPETPPLECENWPWALKLYTLGRFSIVRDGKAIQFRGKIQKRPLSMLKAIIALGGREVSEERVIDALWPEVEGDLAHESFKVSLRRLRNLLGSEKFVLLAEGRVSLDPRYCWVDVWAFERILRKADDADKGGYSDQAIKLIEKALSLCHGSFLSDEAEEPWVTALRNRSRSKFIRSIATLGHEYEQAGQCEKALQWYKKGLEIDALCEEFYCNLMTCYERAGRKAEALAVYRLCRENLAAILGIDPSPGTEAIYQRLKVE